MLDFTAVLHMNFMWRVAGSASISSLIIAELKVSKKDIRENRMILDLVRNDFDQISDATVTKLFEVNVRKMGSIVWAPEPCYLSLSSTSRLFDSHFSAWSNQIGRSGWWFHCLRLAIAISSISFAEGGLWWRQSQMDEKWGANDLPGFATGFLSRFYLCWAVSNVPYTTIGVWWMGSGTGLFLKFLKNEGCYSDDGPIRFERRSASYPMFDAIFRIYLFSKVWIRWGVKELFLRLLCYQ